MKYLIFLLLIISLTCNIFASGSKRKEQDRCESSTFCVHGKMPLFSQGNWNLIKYINSKTSYSVTRDKGYCSPTAQAMFLAGLKLGEPKVKFRNFLDQLTDQNVKSKLPEVIYNAGQGMGTNWKKGGTRPFRILWYSRKMYKRVRNYKKKERRSSWSGLNAGTKAKDFKKQIKKHKVAVLINLGEYKGRGHKLKSVDCSKDPCKINYKTGSYYRRISGHTLVINGYEGDYFKIYDPWGRIYNVRIDRQFIVFGHRAFFFHMSGAFGFVKAYGMDLDEAKNAIILDSFYEIGIED